MGRSIIGFRGGLGITLVVLLAAAVGYFWWSYTEKEREIARLRQAIEHLTASYPIARLVVVGQDEELPGEPTTHVRVTFLDDRGRRRGDPVEATLDGARVYFEALLVIFEDPLVQTGERRAMAFPTRLFTDVVPPREGRELSVLDERGVPVLYDRPEAPPGGLPLPEYRDVLRRFWDLANDPSEAAEYGIRVLQGQAVFTEYEIGRYYQIFVEADGGLVIRPELHWLED